MKKTTITLEIEKIEIRILELKEISEWNDLRTHERCMAKIETLEKVKDSLTKSLITERQQMIDFAKEYSSYYFQNDNIVSPRTFFTNIYRQDGN